MCQCSSCLCNLLDGLSDQPPCYMRTRTTEFFVKMLLLSSNTSCSPMPPTNVDVLVIFYAPLDIFPVYFDFYLPVLDTVNRFDQAMILIEESVRHSTHIFPGHYTSLPIMMHAASITVAQYESLSICTWDFWQTSTTGSPWCGCQSYILWSHICFYRWNNCLDDAAR